MAQHPSQPLLLVIYILQIENNPTLVLHAHIEKVGKSISFRYVPRMMGIFLIELIRC
jgi:hypothetical protein